MKNTCVFLTICALFAGCQSNKKQYYEKHLVFPEGSTIEQKVEMAAHLTPTPQQLAWQQLELTAFLHFGINTFTNREWGDGKEDPKLFNPTQLDAEQWVKTLKDAGFKMAILTAKHHDGFCLFPSKYTHFNSVEMGPKRNITGELTEAVRDAGIRMGLYYSGLIDWQYANDPIFEDDDLFGTASPTFAYADYSYNQMKELVDDYAPSVFWNDIGWPTPSEEMMPYFFAHYYNKVPEGVVNDRFNGRYHDFLTKEYKSGSVNRNEKWEMCRGMGLSFGYNANEGDDKLISVPDLISLLVGTVANNGNLLLNIGPKADGTIPEEQVRRLKILGAWLKVNHDGIYGTRCSDRESELLESGIELHYTQKDGNLNVFADHLKEGANEFLIKGYHGALRPFDPAVKVETEDTAEGLLVKIPEYKEDMYVVGLTNRF